MQGVIMVKTNFKKAYVLTVDMGYGHQRAAYPLRKIAQGGIIVVNNYSGIPRGDREIWKQSRSFYEAMSRFKNVPLIGETAWKIYDKFQEIPNFYPKRDLSATNIQLAATYNLFKSKNWGKHLIEKLNKKPLPIISTFFIPAFMAEYFGYQGEIYCVVCDADVARTWAPLHPVGSRIKYLVPSFRAAKRLQMYGIDKSRIHFTGFPLPEENLETLHKDMVNRLINLDPKGNYLKYYRKIVQQVLALKKIPKKSNHKLTITFAVGGAGAQREIATNVLKGLVEKIKNNKLHLNLVAGIHNDVASYFRQAIRQCGLYPCLGKQIKIISATKKQDYFKKFNQLLKITDILWTKPSELSFYVALGLPIVIAPPIGSQEEFNSWWLTKMGSGLAQGEIEYVADWLFEWLDNGWLAEAAIQGYIEGERLGFQKISNLVFKH